MANVRLSTFDNPYNPFDSFYDWLLWDELHGYNSCGYLAKIARTSNQFSDYENEQEVERAIDDIIAHDVTGMRCKVTEGAPLPRLVSVGAAASPDSAEEHA